MSSAMKAVVFSALLSWAGAAAVKGPNSNICSELDVKLAIDDDQGSNGAPSKLNLARDVILEEFLIKECLQPTPTSTTSADVVYISSVMNELPKITAAMASHGIDVTSLMRQMELIPTGVAVTGPDPREALYDRQAGPYPASTGALFARQAEIFPAGNGTNAYLPTGALTAGAPLATGIGVPSTSGPESTCDPESDPSCSGDPSTTGSNDDITGGDGEPGAGGDGEPGTGGDGEPGTGGDGEPGTGDVPPGTDGDNSGGGNSITATILGSGAVQTTNAYYAGSTGAAAQGSFGASAAAPAMTASSDMLGARATAADGYPVTTPGPDSGLGNEKRDPMLGFGNGKNTKTRTTTKKNWRTHLPWNKPKPTSYPYGAPYPPQSTTSTTKKGRLDWLHRKPKPTTSTTSEPWSNPTPPSHQGGYGDTSNPESQGWGDRVSEVVPNSDQEPGSTGGNYNVNVNWGQGDNTPPGNAGGQPNPNGDYSGDSNTTGDDSDRTNSNSNSGGEGYGPPAVKNEYNGGHDYSNEPGGDPNTSSHNTGTGDNGDSDNTSSDSTSHNSGGGYGDPDSTSSDSTSHNSGGGYDDSSDYTSSDSNTSDDYTRKRDINEGHSDQRGHPARGHGGKGNIEQKIEKAEKQFEKTIENLVHPGQKGGHGKGGKKMHKGGATPGQNGGGPGAHRVEKGGGVEKKQEDGSPPGFDSPAVQGVAPKMHGKECEHGVCPNEKRDPRGGRSGSGRSHHGDGGDVADAVFSDEADDEEHGGLRGAFDDAKHRFEDEIEVHVHSEQDQDQDQSDQSGDQTYYSPGDKDDGRSNSYSRHRVMQDDGPPPSHSWADAPGYSQGPAFADHGDQDESDQTSYESYYSQDYEDDWTSNSYDRHRVMQNDGLPPPHGQLGWSDNSHHDPGPAFPDHGDRAGPRVGYESGPPPRPHFGYGDTTGHRTGYEDGPAPPHPGHDEPNGHHVDFEDGPALPPYPEHGDITGKHVDFEDGPPAYHGHFRDHISEDFSEDEREDYHSSWRTDNDDDRESRPHDWNEKRSALPFWA